MPAVKFAKYEVLARLATGGAANIYLARQPGAAGFQKLVCLKTLLPERAKDSDFVEMFLDEARLVARLSHPNCVHIYDLGRERSSYYISMEYIFGETLWNLLATVARIQVALPCDHVASIVASACDGLHHAHELKDASGRPYNLIHRDVSPQNIMISFEGLTKVLDFGIAKAETDRAPTIAGIVKGKFSYMSPEQITGGEIDRRSDIYALGVVLFECLASRRLYRADSPEEIARMILDERTPRLRDVVPDIPVTLDELCAKALERRPEKRFQSAQAMGNALREHLDNVRFRQNRESIAKLVKERFKDRYEQRRRILDAALIGTHEEANLLKALDAKPVQKFDLIPSEEDAAGGDGPTFLKVSATVSTPAKPRDDGQPPKQEFDPANETIRKVDPQVAEALEASLRQHRLVRMTIMLVIAIIGIAIGIGGGFWISKIIDGEAVATPEAEVIPKRTE